MDDLTAEFLHQIQFSPLCDYDELEYKSNYDDFTVVDSEEGDYGIIRHYHENGKLLAVTTVKGGDEEETEFTEYAKELLRPLAVKLLNECIDKYI